MISDFETLFSGAQQFLERSEGQTLSWKGATYTCLAAHVATEQDYEREGYRHRQAVDIETSLSQYGTAYPASGDSIVYDGSTYAVPPEIMRDAVSLRFRAYRTSA